MAHCPRCNEELPKGTPLRDHQCDLVRLSDGRWVKAKRVDDYNGDVHQEILAGKVTVLYRPKREPLRRTSERFGGNDE